jgi:hypothetical protein
VELEDSGEHVVYFESSKDLEMTDVDIADVLLAIAHHKILRGKIRPLGHL